MSFEIEIGQDGRGGTDYYVEGGHKLPFEWDYSSIGITIDVPTPEEWDTYCQKQDANWAKGRREEILKRLAEGVRGKKVRSAQIHIGEHWVDLVFQRPWIFRFLKKVFG